MNKEIIVSEEMPLLTNTPIEITEPQCWLVQIKSQPCELHFQWGKTSDHQQFLPGWRGLLFLHRVKVTLLSGIADYQVLPLHVLAKLHVFIDASREVAMEYGQNNFSSVEIKDFPVIKCSTDIERWMLGYGQHHEAEMLLIGQFLRQTECYWLINFLLKESLTNEKLNVLGARYGLSYSHFRRLCRNALGNSAKNELRGWRIARSLLDMVEERQSLTEVAMRYGYASSSHLSNDIRDVFGVSPRGIWNLINKKAEK